MGLPVPQGSNVKMAATVFLGDGEADRIFPQSKGTSVPVESCQLLWVSLNLDQLKIQVDPCRAFRPGIGGGGKDLDAPLQPFPALILGLTGSTPYSLPAQFFPCAPSLHFHLPPRNAPALLSGKLTADWARGCSSSGTRLFAAVAKDDNPFVAAWLPLQAMCTVYTGPLIWM